MNQLKSADAKLRLQPGAEPGGSNVIVQRIQKDRFRGYLTWDNQGSEATGQNQLNATLELDDFLGLNDAWSLNLGSTENTNAASLSASVPFGYAQIAEAENISKRMVQHLTDFAFLAPDVIAAIRNGTHPPALTTEWLKRNDLPINCQDRRALFARLQ